MAEAIWNGVTLAKTNTIAHVEGNIYFPIDAVNWDYLLPNRDVAVTFCHWKGFASYFDVIVDGEKNIGAAWRYEEPYEEASLIKGHIAFWKGVEVIDAPQKGRGVVEPSTSRRGNKSGWEAFCWLIRHSKKSTLDANEIFKNTESATSSIPRKMTISASSFVRIYGPIGPNVSKPFPLSHVKPLFF